MDTCYLYDKSVCLEFDSDRHVYLANGKKIDGVTGALDVISKPALIPWAAKCTAEYVEENWKPGVAYDEIQIKEVLKLAKNAHRHKKDRAADIGSLVHAWIEAYANGATLQPLPINEEAKLGVGAFLQWVNEHKVVFEMSEVKVYSKKYEYAGTLDFIATVDGHRMLGDIKTSSNIYDVMFLQTSAYQLARQEEFPTEEFMGHVIVNCKKDGKLLTKISAASEYKPNSEAFLFALGLRRRIRQMEESL